MVSSRGAGAKFTPVIYEYLKRFQDDPSSRVFAPLAEAYRKAGLIDEAVKIASEGVKQHPQFVGGRVALARALFDQKSYLKVIDELTQVVNDVPDNLVAQKLYAESCLMVGNLQAALSSYKMLLYFSPQDAEVAQVVEELESSGYRLGELTLRSDPDPDPSAGFEVQPVSKILKGDPTLRKSKAIQGIERLQGFLQQIERYRNRVSLP
jgi:tetratricopeptide (TPR) repeat protein